MPVVRMQYVGNEVSILTDLKRGFAKEGVTKSVVAILAEGIAVDSWASIETIIFHEPNRNLVVELGGMKTDPVFLPVPHVNAGGTVKSDAVKGARNRSIERKNHSHVVTEPAQGLGKSCNDITKSAGFGVGSAFGGNEEDSQGESRQLYRETGELWSEKRRKRRILCEVFERA